MKTDNHKNRFVAETFSVKEKKKDKKVTKQNKNERKYSIEIEKKIKAIRNKEKKYLNTH